jgi:hypothetical protein
MLQAKNFEFAQHHVSSHNPPIVINMTSELGYSSEHFVGINPVGFWA